jgi:hypothetical protein
MFQEILSHFLSSIQFETKAFRRRYMPFSPRTTGKNILITPYTGGLIQIKIGISIHSRPLERGLEFLLGLVEVAKIGSIRPMTKQALWDHKRPDVFAASHLGRDAGD